jgi:hypothetical protein
LGPIATLTVVGPDKVTVSVPPLGSSSVRSATVFGKVSISMFRDFTMTRKLQLVLVPH